MTPEARLTTTNIELIESPIRELSEAEENESFNKDSSNGAYRTVLRNARDRKYKYITLPEARLRVSEMISSRMIVHRHGMSEQEGFGFLRNRNPSDPRYQDHKSEWNRLQKDLNAIYTDDYLEDSTSNTSLDNSGNTVSPS